MIILGLQRNHFHPKNHNNVQTSLIYDYEIFNKTKEEISTEYNVYISQVALLIKKFKRYSKVRAVVNKRFLNKKQKFEQPHLELKKLHSGINSTSHKMQFLKK